MTISEATDVLFEHRHNLPTDVLRTLQDVWLCASKAHFGEPYEEFWRDEDWHDHDMPDQISACEADELYEETA